MTEVENRNTASTIVAPEAGVKESVNPTAEPKTVKKSESPVVILKSELKKFDFSKIRANKADPQVSSGETMYLDFQRTNLVINGNEIDRNFIAAFMEGSKDYKNELFNRDDFDNLSEESKAFIESAPDELDQDRLNEVWKDHCKNPKVAAGRKADEYKTDEYKKEFEKFYNAGRKFYHLFSKKDYRALAKEIFKEIFTYYGAEIPSDAILEELVTNCNQAGYLGALYGEDKPFFRLMEVHGLAPESKNTTYINCSDMHHVSIIIKEKISIRPPVNSEQAIHMDNSLEFTLESQDGKDDVVYKNGNLTLTSTKELKNYKVGDKNLLDIIKELFQKLCEKLGFSSEIKIERSLEEPNSSLNNMKTIHCNNRKHVD